MTRRTPSEEGSARCSSYLPASGLVVKEGMRKRLGIERSQILERLADPDGLDRDAQLTGDRERDAALGRPVELRQHDPGDVDRARELARLAQPVLAGGRVDHDECLV